MSATVNDKPMTDLRARKRDDEEGKLEFALQLRALTFKQMLTANGIKRVILINELIQHRVQLEMRVNVARLQERHPGATELTIEGPDPMSVGGGTYPPVEYTFTERWQKVNPAVAFWFHQQMWAQRELGCTYLDDGYFKQRNQEGEIVLNWREVSVPRVAGILEFRAPADATAEGDSTTPSGLYLPRVELPTAPAHTGLPPGLSLDDLPELEGEPDESALSQLAPAAPRRAPARKPAE